MSVTLCKGLRVRTMTYAKADPKPVPLAANAAAGIWSRGQGLMFERTTLTNQNVDCAFHDRADTRSVYVWLLSRRIAFVSLDYLK
jgi:hypothetical protein